MLSHQCGNQNQPGESSCDKCESALSVPPQQSPPCSTEQSVPALWNPNSAALWSLVFSAAFGAYLQMLNWRALGETEKASSARNWFFLLLGLAVVLSILDIACAIQTPAHVGVLLLVAWWYASGRIQHTYVKQKFGKTFPRKPWGKPLAIGVASVTAYVVVEFALRFGVDLMRGVDPWRY